MYIYKVTNLLNGKIYVGLSIKSVMRSQNYYGSGICIKSAIKKYGKENFVKEILEENIASLEALYEREIYWIEKLNAKKDGYNLSAGGNFNGVGGMKGKKHSEDAKNKMSNRRKNVPLSAEHRQGISKALKGRISTKVYTSQEIQRMSDSHKGNKPSEETKKKMSESHRGKFSGPVNVTCPHCGKTGSSNAMKRWHFEKCRSCA